MKPITLNMEAFGSYGKKVTIDFTRPHQNLFLIAGDTGAGKSTIFDAIVFALYGKASSDENEKKGEILRSQYAELSVEPFVELVFSEGEDTYIVKRIPAYRKLQARGTGKGALLKEKAEAEKVSLTMTNGQEYLGSVKETDKKIEEIVGLTKEQFMQVAMIAQGEFMKLLRADSNDKKTVFRKLFHTEIFEKIVKELDNRRKDKNEELKVLRAQCHTIVSRVKIFEDDADRENLIALKEQITGGMLANMERFITELGAFCISLEEEQTKLRSIYQEAEKNRDEKNRAYDKMERLLKDFNELDRANQSLAECESMREEIKQAHKDIQSIRAAYELQILFWQYRDAKEHEEETEKNIRDNKERLPLLDKVVKEADAMQKKVQSEFETQQAALSKITERVDVAKKAFERIGLVEQALKKNRNAFEKAKTDENKEQTALELLAKKELEWRERAKALGNAEVLYEAWKGKHTEAKRLEKEVENLKKIKSELSEQDIKMQQSQARFEQARNAYETRNDAYQALNKRYMASRAKYFVDRLEDGQPCPICGAVEHPAPCWIGADVEDISEETLEAVKGEVEALNKKQSDAAEKSGAAVTAYTEKKKAFHENLKQLCESIHKQIGVMEQEVTKDNVEVVFRQWQSDLEKEGKTLEEKVREFQKLKRFLSDVEEEKNKLRERIDVARKAMEIANAAVKGDESEIRSLKERLEYKSQEEADQELQIAKRSCNSKEKEYREVSQRAKKAAEDQTKTETLLKQYEDALPNQTVDRKQKEEAYKKAMQEKDLSETEWKELVEKNPKDRPEQLQQKVKEYERKKTAAESIRDTTQNAIEGKERPDPAILEEERKAAQEAYDNARESFDRVKELYRDNQGVYSELEPLHQKYAVVASAYSRLEWLYKLFSGNTSGGRMDIETYVQRYYLGKILSMANRRFQEMSVGQFELRMIDLDRAGEGRSNKGLDLMVYSTVTGKIREIRTLSGGESFMAALALSLGMADQIQQSVAALNLDIMFIDEGFGSLDDHARSQAVKVLKEMAGGSRLVGIISHVTELKQEIDDQLLVCRDENGSHINWQTS